MKKLLAIILIASTGFIGAPLQSFAQTEEDPCWFDADYNQFCRQDDGSILEIPNPFFEAREIVRASATLFELTAAWNDVPLNSTVSIPVGEEGTLAWSFVTHPVAPFIPWSTGHVVSFDSIFESATLTLDVFKGELGSSTLIASIPVSHGTNPSLPLQFDEPGKYVIVFSATYERTDEGTVPGLTAEDICTGGSGDLCPVASFPLEPFRGFIRYGKENQDGTVELPVMYDVIEIEVAGGSVGAPNVLFLPGFTASRLYTKKPDGGERRLWEPNGSNDVKDMALIADGTSPLTVYTRDIVDSILNLPFGFTVHEEFMEYLNELKEEGKIVDWKGYPYDWRYDVFDVVDDGALKEDGSREYLIPVIEQLAATAKNGKVAIVAHSNGGLVAKALMVRLEAAGKAHLVDQIILIASPQAGTPKGVFSLLHGREKLLNFIIPAGVLRNSLATLPGAYSLAPSKMYFDRESSNLASFAAGTKTDSFISTFGETLDSAPEMRNFALNDPVTRATPTLKESGTPLPLSPLLIAKMEQTHEILDAWQPPVGVEIHEIAGWGQPTVSGSSYYTINQPCPENPFFCSRPTIEYRPILSKDGDETVMSASALLQNQGVYFDLFTLDNLEDGEDERRKHIDITESVFIHEYLGNLLTIEDSYNGDLFVSAKPNSLVASTVVGVHSPAILQATDAFGNKTGIFRHPDPTSDLMYVKEEIPGSSVELGGEAKYLVLPEDGDYDLTIQGTGTGVFGITFADEAGTVFKEFRDLPISTSTTAVVPLNDTDVGSLLLDLEGDGKIDANIDDKLTRKDAIGICKKEIGLVRTLVVKIYLAVVISNIELQGKDNARFQKFVTELKNYVQSHLSSIPSDRAAAIATCIRALENSKK